MAKGKMTKGKMGKGEMAKIGGEMAKGELGKGEMGINRHRYRPTVDCMREERNTHLRADHACQLFLRWTPGQYFIVWGGAPYGQPML
jgi:hypothetical protein